MLTLYYAPGACSLAAHIVLEEGGEKYEARRVDLSKGEQRTPEYLKIHPLGRVPALLLDNGEPLTENTAILPYLGKRFKLWPADPVADAKALQPDRLLRLFGASGARPHRPPRALRHQQGGLRRHPGHRQEVVPRLPRRRSTRCTRSANGSPTSTRCSIRTRWCSTRGA